MKKINYQSVSVDDVKAWDYPDFCDAFVEYAEWEDGTPLTDDEINLLNENNPEVAQEAALNNFF